MLMASNFRILEKSQDITEEQEKTCLKYWVKLAEALENIMKPLRGGVFYWGLRIYSQKNRDPFILARVSWFNGKDMFSRMEGVLVCAHQLHPDNITHYVGFIAKTLKDREKSAAEQKVIEES